MTLSALTDGMILGSVSWKLATIIGIILSLLSFGSAYDSFTNIGLWPKLYVTAIAALFFVFGIARWLANYLRPSEVNIGFGLPEPRRSRYRFALFSLLLAVCCILFIILAILLTNRFTLQLIEATAADTSGHS